MNFAKVLTIICFAIGAVITIWFLMARKDGANIKALILKSLSSVGFMATAAVAFAASGMNSGFGLFVLIGLLFGLLGDLWLDLKFIYPAENDPFTFAGFCVFAVQHIFLIAGLYIYAADWSCTKGILFAIIPLVVGLLAGILNVLFLEKPMKLNYGKFKMITGVYGGILIAMTLIVGALAIYNGFAVAQLNVMFVGAVFFLISDLILSGTYFGEGKNRPIDVITNHATYYLGQFLIALSLMFLA